MLVEMCPRSMGVTESPRSLGRLLCPSTWVGSDVFSARNGDGLRNLSVLGRGLRAATGQHGGQRL